MPHFNNNTILVVGIYFAGVYGRPDLIKKIEQGRKIILKREPNNQHDKNAVAVYIEGESHYYGYIPSDIAAELAPILDRGSKYDCKIIERRGSQKQPTIVISLTTHPIPQTSPVYRQNTTNIPRTTNTRNKPLTPTGKQFRKITDWDTHIRKLNGASGIYIIWNRQNKIYVGSSSNIGARWRSHRNQLLSRSHGNQKLQHDWVQMGVDAFRFDVVERVWYSKLAEREIYFINRFDSYRNGYNATPDGQADPEVKSDISINKTIGVIENTINTGTSKHTETKKQELHVVKENSNPKVNTLSGSNTEESNTQTNSSESHNKSNESNQARKRAEQAREKAEEEAKAYTTIGKWILGIACGVSVIWLVNIVGQNNNKPSHTPPPQERRFSFLKNSPAPVLQTPSASTSSVSKKPSAQYTREAQHLLTDLGYDPGLVDGLFGRRTANAVKAFQRDVGITQDGWIDRDLLNTLRRARAEYKPSGTTLPTPLSQTTQQPRSSAPPVASTATASYFSAGERRSVANTYKLAEQESAKAQYELGLKHYHGEGIPINYPMAIKWFQKAAEQGYAEAFHAMGYMYRFCDDIPKSEAKAHSCFKKAAEQGHVLAQFQLGVMYNNGVGIPVNYKEAVGWFTKAAEQGLDSAQWALGIKYEFGHGVSVNYKKAFKWYQRAAKQGHAGAQYDLAILYGSGYGTPRNNVKMYVWMKIALANGQQEAKEFIELLTNEMTHEQIAKAQKESSELWPQVQK